jgi:3-oxoacyl-[acyl-carrier protein] reductase
MNRVALVTGGSGGFGTSLAHAFSKAGYGVVVHYFSNRDSAEAVAGEIRKNGGDAMPVGADITDAGEVSSMSDRVISKWGRVDVLVNNAGITHESPLALTKEDDWDAVMAINLKGAFLCSRSVVPLMAERGGGHIINISSILGMWGGRGESGYAASKAALFGFTKSLAMELGPSGVRVNAVMPGFMLTRMTESSAPAALRRAKEENVLGGYTGQAASAGFVVNLAGMDTITGQIFNLDGRIFRWI